MANPFDDPSAQRPAPQPPAPQPPAPQPSAPETPLDPTCPFVDVAAQQQLATRLLCCLANQVGIQKRSPEDGVTRLRTQLLPDNKAKAKKGGLTLAALEERLEKAETSAGAKGLGSDGFTTALFTSREELQRRVAEAHRSLDADNFRHARREKLAAELIRSWDAAQTAHCGECVVPGSEAAERHRLSCAFRPTACAHEGCVEYYSARRGAAHDAVCPFKPCDCSRGCGARLPRRELAAHEEGPCPHKPARCPLACFGCAAALTQGTLAAHVRDEAPAHVLLLAAALEARGAALEALATAHAEAQAEAATLRARLAAADTERAALRREVGAALQAGGAQGAAELKRVEAAAAEAKKQVAALAKDAGRDRAELAKLKAEQARLAQAVARG